MDNAEALVAIFGMLTGIVVTGAIVWGVVQGIKHRYGGQLADPALGGEVAALREQVDHLQQQLVEVHERIDFTERLLTRGRDPHEGQG